MLIGIIVITRSYNFLIILSIVFLTFTDALSYSTTTINVMLLIYLAKYKYVDEDYRLWLVHIFEISIYYTLDNIFLLSCWC